jgi:error-prone DNA polymerase
VEAKIERETEQAEVPITHLICRTLTDRTELLNSLMHREAKLPWGDAALARADAVRRPEPGSRRPARMPGSRDFH